MKGYGTSEMIHVPTYAEKANFFGHTHTQRRNQGHIKFFFYCSGQKKEEHLNM